MAAKIKDKYSKEVARYAKEQGEIEAEAKAAEEEVAIERRRADRFDLGEVMLEAGLVICSITLMTRKRIFWQAGTLLGLVGVGDCGRRVSYPLTPRARCAPRLAFLLLDTWRHPLRP